MADTIKSTSELIGEIEKIEIENNPGGNTKLRIGNVLRGIVSKIKDFTTFALKTGNFANDYVVGYNSESNNKDIRIPVKSILSEGSYYCLLQPAKFEGKCNGSNKEFEMEYAFTKTVVYLNGIRLMCDIDYIEVDKKEIVILDPPPKDAKLYVEIIPE